MVEINARRFQFTGQPNLTTEYDVPVDAWYTEKNSYPTMPYSVLMEIALQPCGFLSAYIGSTLAYPDEDFYFRNLDGTGMLHRDFDLQGKTISNTVTLLSQTALSGIIIQKFSYVMSVDGELFYEGTAVFGYFQPDSLINQVGLDKGKDVLPWFKQENVSGTEINLRGGTELLAQGSPHYRLAGGRANFIDKVIVIPDGGREGKGYVYAERNVDASDWFFSCHFYQDPVMPGSLGVEAVIEAMQAYALDQDLGAHLQNPHFSHTDNHEVVWIYRGQIAPNNAQMYLEVDITNVASSAEQVVVTGNASLWKTGMRIYEVKDISIRLVNS
ncbi:MAG: beta-hydroxydecanoyl-ACP dehydratase [Chloroflexi bacterium]|nr:beta-hydroxydecanoyl-ACP dehydratase [Chloroflexota bacterium]